MIIHRSHPESGFAVIPNATLRDPRLSYRARGVLAELLSRPEDWVTSADALWRRARAERGKAGEGRRDLREVFAELEAAGYLYRALRRRGRGRFATELHLFDAPDGREAWLAAEAFRAMVDVSAGGTDDHPGGGRSEQGKQPPEDVSAGGTDDHPGGGRSEQGKQPSSQVAPTTNKRYVGDDLGKHAFPQVAPTTTRVVAITKTDNEDLSTKTDPDENYTGLLTEPAEVERARARPGQDRFISDEEWERRERVAARALGPLPQAAS